MHVRDLDISSLPLGTKSRMTLDATNHRDAAAKLDVAIIRGALPGKTLFALGGVHGDEYEGPTALWQLIDRLQPEEISGTVILLPVANWKAFEAEQRCTPDDGANLNRCFPGDPKGTYTEVLAWDIFEHFVRPSDMVVDLHSGGAAFSFHPVVGYVRDCPSAAFCLEACERFGLDMIWSLPGRDGVMTNAAARAGRIAIGCEYGGEARLDPAGAEAYARGVIRSLQFLGILPGSAPRNINARVVEGDFLIAETKFGRFQSLVANGDPVSAGQRIGFVTDFQENACEEILALHDGVIAAIRTRPVIHRGEWTINPVRVCTTTRE
jgi:N-alpha-acetyl-L-2,4-diaminobutyrate deacetylase